MPGINCPVVAYAPIAAMTPSIAAQPLILSAFSFISFLLCFVENYNLFTIMGKD
jgi:hypothetical protein